jgi:hypothetical protein
MSEPNLETKILAEIKKSGFPFELDIAANLQSYGFDVAQSLYYIDQDEQKGREFDIRAYKKRSLGFPFRTCPPLIPNDIRHENGLSRELVDTENFVGFCLLIECKRSQDPWVIFTSEKTNSDPIQNFELEHFHEYYEWFSQAFAKKDINYFNEEHKKRNPFGQYSRRGRTFFEPFAKPGGDMIFKAITSVVKATIATKEIKFGIELGRTCYYCPIVVFDGNLFEAYFEGNEIILRPKDSVLVSFFYTSPSYYCDYLVPVMTKQGLFEFCRNLNLIFDLYTWLYQNIKPYFR